jgi:hypothetical protein
LVIKTVTTFGHQNGDRIWSSKLRPHLVIATQCKAEKHILVIKTVTTFGHQNANHIWSPTPGPHEVFTSRTTFGGKTVTVFGHQNGNRNKQFFVVLKTVLE